MTFEFRPSLEILRLCNPSQVRYGQVLKTLPSRCQWYANTGLISVDLIEITVFMVVMNEPHYVVCKVCPPAHNGQKPICRCHVADHASSKKHLRSLQKASQKQGTILPPVGPPDCFPPISFEVEMEDDLQTQPRATPPPTSDVAHGRPADFAAPLSQLWEEFQAERTIFLDDYFEEMQQRIKRGESLFSSVLPPLEDELGIEEDNEEDLAPFAPTLDAIFTDYSIDLDGMCFTNTYYTFVQYWAAVASRTSHRTRSKTSVNVSPEEPLYPWRTMPVCTDVVSLFLSTDACIGILNSSSVQFASPKVLARTKSRGSAMGEGTWCT